MKVDIKEKLKKEKMLRELSNDHRSDFRKETCKRSCIVIQVVLYNI